MLHALPELTSPHRFLRLRVSARDAGTCSAATLWRAF